MERIKVFLLGEQLVGKTAIISHYIEKTFPEDSIQIFYPEKSIKEIELENGTKIKIEIWDTVGQNTIRMVNKIFMKNTQIALIVYDITNRESFDVLNEFYEQIDEVNGKENVFFAIVGNKSDLYEEQVVSSDIGKE